MATDPTILKRVKKAILILTIIFVIPSTALTQEPCYVEIDADTDLLLTYGDSIRLLGLFNFTPAEIESIAWQPENTLSCGDCLSPVARPIEDVCYTLTLIGTAGCIAKDTICIAVIPPSISIGPNPAFNEITIYAEGYLVYQYKIYNKLGQLIGTSSNDLLVWEENIDVSFLAKGIYYIVVQQAETITTQQFVKL